MDFPSHKTKIVATIGPASDAPDMLRRLLRAGMSVVRINFSHGDFAAHAETIARVRAAAREEGLPVAVMADLPGPKIRIGVFEREPVELRRGARFTLTAADTPGTEEHVSTTLPELPDVVRSGSRIFLNDGLVALRVLRVVDGDVECEVEAGGELRSRKGLNLPGADLGIRAFTDHDRACLEFALDHGVDAVSQSFVETAADIEAVRAAARARGADPFVIAKIERAGALKHLDELLAAADGVMVARGDLGVEVPVEEIALLQKEIIGRANLAGKPVITATQMLESMVSSRIPTRAEATDVANAILDGTDGVMLSAESAMGRYPEEAVAMLARIAAATEAQLPPVSPDALRARFGAVHPAGKAEAVAGLVDEALDRLPCAAVVVPSRTGATARLLSRGKPPVWIVALCSTPAAARDLLFSWGVHPVPLDHPPDDWDVFAHDLFPADTDRGKTVLLVTGPRLGRPGASHRIEFIPVV